MEFASPYRPQGIADRWVGVPVSLVMMFAAWWWLTQGGFALGTSEDSTTLIQDELSKLGPMTPAERRVGAIFLLVALAWVFRPLLNDVGIGWLSDTSIAIAAGLMLFLLPSDNIPGVRLLDWDRAKDLPWGVLLLFGGGLALAGVIRSSGLAEWIADQLPLFGAMPLIMLIGLVVLVIIFLTEVTSHTATAAAFLPLLGALALSLDVSVLLITMPAAIAANCAFMMPVATSPNAIVFATGHMKIQSMIRAGFLLNLAGTVVVTLLAYLLVSTFW